MKNYLGGEKASSELIFTSRELNIHNRAIKHRVLLCRAI